MKTRFILTLSTVFIATSVIVLSLRKSGNEFLSSFNFIRHFKSLHNTTTRKGEITCFNGMKSFAMFVIIAFHCYAVNTSNLDPKSSTYKSWGEGKYLMSKFFGTIMVDIFLVIGAILATRSTLKYLRRWVLLKLLNFSKEHFFIINILNLNIIRGDYNYFQCVVSRYSRIMLMVGFILLINALLSSWKENYDCYDAVCQRWWWKTLLSIQNLFVDVEEEHLVRWAC